MPAGFQPGSPPSSPLPIPVALIALGFLAGAALWRLLNPKPAAVDRGLQAGDTVPIGPGVGNTSFGLYIDRWAQSSGFNFCGGGVWQPAYRQLLAQDQGFFAAGQSLTILRTSRTTSILCQAGTNSGGEFDWAVQVNFANGTTGNLVQLNRDQTLYGSFATGSEIQTVENFRINVGGVSSDLRIQSPGIRLEAERPQVPDAPDARALPAPVAAPLAAPLPAARPLLAPSPSPATAPQQEPGQTAPESPRRWRRVVRVPTAPVVPSAPALPAAAPVEVDRRPQPVPVPVRGPLPVPEPEPIRQLDPTVVTYPGIQVGQPGSIPPPTLQGIASEVGRIEQKVARLLTDGPPVDLPDLGALLDLLQALLSQVDGTTYQLRVPCGRDENGDPLPPIEFDVPSRPDASSAILARLDTLAAMLDEHKQLRQPICKGKPAGEPVTVTFAEIP